MSAPEIAPAPRYSADGCQFLERLVTPEVAAFLSDHAALLLDAGRLEPDLQVPGSWIVYGDSANDTVLAMVTGRVSDAIDIDLEPTYSFLRLYRHGQELVPHRDRPECEHSATLHLASSGGTGWPLWLRSGDRDPLSFVTSPGDAVIYRGDRLLHWRDPLRDQWHAQLFLHWVDRAGPNASRRFDGRPALGLPRETRR